MSDRTERLLGLYRRMLLIRRAEEAIQEHYGEDEMKTPVHLSIGQEAVAVGVCDALDAGDQVVGTYRSHGIYLAMSDDPEGMFGELYGRVTGPGRGKAGSMHLAHPDSGLMLTSAVVGTTIPVALGLAYAQLRRGNGRRVAAFFGDGALDEGAFWESLNFACLKRLPVLFVCEDNGLAIHTRGCERQGYSAIADAVRGFDCHCLELDSTDPAEISTLTHDGIERQRKDGRPVFLHLSCYRYVEHVGPRIDRDFHLAHRTKEEFESWMDRDPIRAQRGRLEELGVPGDVLAGLEREVAERIAGCVELARRSPPSDPKELHEDLFA